MRTHLPLKRLLLATAAALTLCATPAMAGVAQIGPDGYLDITESTPGEANDLYIKVLPVGGVNKIQVTDTLGMTPGNGCTAGTAGVICDDPPNTVRVNTGMGNDKFGVSEVGTNLTFGAGSVVADLGPGNDIYDASATNASLEVHGGDGNDQLEGAINVDKLDGGPGDDKLQGNQGADELRGGPGNDELTGDKGANAGIFADVLDGGDGRDTLRDYYSDVDPAKAPAISLSLDGVANDGRSGENDAISSIEIFQPQSAGSFVGDDADNDFTSPEVGAAGTLVGKGGNDTLIAGDSNGDQLDGGNGDDLLEGGFGDDKLVGGPGKDTVNGDRKSRCNEFHCDYLGAGNDTIEVRDGEIDSVTCGVGQDKVVADPDDVVAADCETVERAALNNTNTNNDTNADDKGKDGRQTKKKGTITLSKVKLAAALRRGLKVKVANVSGTVSLKATRSGKVVAKGSARARTGTATVTLKFTAKAKKSLRRAKKVSLRITGAGVTARVVTIRR
jgi:Ca2+-binding RTX toxin-like protein